MHQNGLIQPCERPGNACLGTSFPEDAAKHGHTGARSVYPVDGVGEGEGRDLTWALWVWVIEHISHVDVPG